MTDRFTLIHIGNPIECVIKDHTTDKTYGMFNSKEQGVKEIVEYLNIQEEWIKHQNDKINELHWENHQLNNEKERLYEKNIRIVQTITEFHNKERTAIGQSVLRQLLEQI